VVRSIVALGAVSTAAWAVGCDANEQVGEVAVAVVRDAGVDVGPDRPTCPSREPAHHRAAPNDCAPSGYTLPCVTDEDCAVFTDAGYPLTGACVATGGGKQCSYDDCLRDSDCLTATDVCVCPNDLPQTPPQRENVCTHGTCRSDSECGDGLYCSPSFRVYCGEASLDAFYCHTCEDTCLDDADCSGSRCTYDPSIGHWACEAGPCSPG
jgi:hypothetical protein